MNPLVLLAAAVVVVGFAVFITFGLRPAKLRADRQTFEERCAALGFTPLVGPTPLYVACGGEVGGWRMMLVLAGKTPGVFLPPHVAIVLEARLDGIARGGVFIRPGSSPDLNGDDASLAALRMALTPELLSGIDTHLGQRFGLRNWDTLQPDAAERVLVKSRWPNDWGGLRLQTWVPLEASGVELRAGLDALLAVRALLARSPGITAR